ncbi:MAG: DsbA family protein [Algicola sp.]|nr:DsbA family protein [Algicola sp.]
MNAQQNITLFFISVFILLLGGCTEAKVATQTIKGQYALVSPLQSHSKSQVTLELFINFSCPHCYKSHHQMQQMQTEYGERLTIQSRPLLPKGDDDSSLRLFHVAKKANKALAATAALYQANFELKLDITKPQVILTLAEELGIKTQYQAQRDAPWVDEAIKNDIGRARHYQVTVTPTWIVEQQLKLFTDFNNLQIVLDDLLPEISEPK